MKFTPGPWHWDCDLIKCESLDRVRYRVTALGKTIAQTYYSSGDENAEADTRLMACAPEMYDLIKALIDSRGEHFINNDALPGWDERAAKVLAKVDSGQ